MSHIRRDGLTKKPVHLRVENTKTGAYATSHLKCDNEDQPLKNTSFSYFFWFLKLLILEREGWTSQICNVPILGLALFLPTYEYQDTKSTWRKLSKALYSPKILVNISARRYFHQVH